MSRGAIGGVGGLVVVVLVVLLGGDPFQALQLLGGDGGGPSVEAGPRGTPSDEEGWFLSAVLAMTEDVWTERFRERGAEYRPPTLVLFDGTVRSACGFTTAATGPFYCPSDQKLYLDTSFFDQLAALGGEGDFAAAYVVGHEVGHHVQTLTGTAARVREGQSRVGSRAEANRLQVRMELQADCYAGVWAHHANRRDQVLEPGDVQEGLAAASAIGDDRLQRRSGGTVQPETFTHGTSEQRREWLQRGLETGSVDACDTSSVM